MTTLSHRCIECGLAYAGVNSAGFCPSCANERIREAAERAAFDAISQDCSIQGHHWTHVYPRSTYCKWCGVRGS